MAYKCVNCKRTVAKIEERVRCPYCGFRIFVKERPEIVRTIRVR